MWLIKHNGGLYFTGMRWVGDALMCGYGSKQEAIASFCFAYDEERADIILQPNEVWEEVPAFVVEAAQV